MRYVKQRDGYGCGPVAVINSLKFFGADISLARDQEMIYDLCRCAPKGQHHTNSNFSGTKASDFYRGLRQAGDYFLGENELVVWTRCLPYLKGIEYWLEEKKGVVVLLILRRCENKYRGHYITVTGRHGKGFLVTNDLRADGSHLSLYHCPRSRFRQLLQHHPTWGYPVACFVRKR